MFSTREVFINRESAHLLFYENDETFVVVGCLHGKEVHVNTLHKVIAERMVDAFNWYLASPFYRRDWFSFRTRTVGKGEEYTCVGNALKDGVITVLLFTDPADIAEPELSTHLVYIGDDDSKEFTGIGLVTNKELVGLVGESCNLVPCKFGATVNAFVSHFDVVSHYCIATNYRVMLENKLPDWVKESGLV